jgi:hypothetical protein
MKLFFSFFLIILFFSYFHSYSQLIWSSYLGGQSGESPNCMNIDNASNIILSGSTLSSNFPTTSGAYNTNYQGRQSDSTDMYITKLNSNASDLIFSTFISLGIITSLSIDKMNNLNFSGISHSNYPTTSFAYRTTGDTNVLNVIATKIKSDGTSLLYSTYIGPGGGILDLDLYGNVFIGGRTDSKKFPITIGAYDTSLHGSGDAFLTKLNNVYNSLIYSTFIGGNDIDNLQDIKVDNLGNAYFGGETYSFDFPVTSNCYDSIHKDRTDIFITKLNPSGNFLMFSTFIGGNNYDGLRKLIIDKDKNVYICGSTQSSDYQITSGAYNSEFKSKVSSYVTKFNPEGNSLIFSTFIADSSICNDIVLDNNGNIMLTGSTNSSNYPITDDAFDKSFNSIDSSSHAIISDCVLTILNKYGNSLIYSSFLGGRNIDDGSNIKLDSLHNIYLSGLTNSTNFPVTDGVFQKKYKGNSDIFVSKFNFCNGSPKIQAIDSIKFPNQLCKSQSQDTTIIIHNTGTCILSVTGSTVTGDFLNEFSVIEPNYIPFYIQPNDSVLLKIRFTPIYVTGSKTATLNLKNNTSVSPKIINLSANYDTIAFNINNQDSDTIIFDLGTICPGAKDTTITIINKSSIGTTFKIENKDPQLQIVPVGKTMKKEGDKPQAKPKK